MVLSSSDLRLLAAAACRKGPGSVHWPATAVSFRPSPLPQCGDLQRPGVEAAHELCHQPRPGDQARHEQMLLRGVKRVATDADAVKRRDAERAGKVAVAPTADGAMPRIEPDALRQRAGPLIQGQALRRGGKE